jgi:4-hydroxymandelate oxidase
MPPLNLLEYEAAARERLDPAFYDYIAGGAGDELTLQRNRSAYERILLRPRVLVDVSEIDQSTSILGIPLKMPVMLSVTAAHRLCHPDGELATAKAAHSMGTLCMVGTLSNYTAVQVAEVTDGPVWFQLYAFKDRAINKFMIDQALAAHAKALVLTVDTPYTGRRERDLRNDLMIPSDLTAGHLIGLPIDQSSQPGQGAVNLFKGEHLRTRAMTWRDLESYRSLAPELPLILKGIITAEDALLAVEHGVDAIIVSNHGGRQVDSCIATIEALPEVVEAVAGRIPVMVDGGIRRGTDVLKALALGASATLIGRPLMWGLAVDGEAGVRHVLQLLFDEIRMAMALCGKAKLADIDRSLIKITSHD